MQRYRTLLINLLIVLIASLLFIPFLGNVHLFDWDEINFAESAREMIVTGDYLNVQINFQLFWEKPPLFIWMQVLSMKLFGINEFAARFPNAIAGIISLLVLFNIGKKHFSKTFGLIWVFAYAGSVLPHLYFKSGIIDPWFNFFIFLGIYFFIVYLINTERKTKFALFSAVFIGLATLTKGPVALLVFLLTGFVYLLLNRFKLRITLKDILLYVLTFAFVGGFWFILQLLNGNYDILYDFIIYQIRLLKTQDSGHGGFFGYHFVVLLIGVFPASLFALKSFKRFKSDKQDVRVFRQWMMILFWVVLILFTIVKTKIVHYSSLAYFPLAFLAAFAIYKTDLGQIKKSGFITGSIIFFAGIFVLLIFGIQYAGMNSLQIIESGIIKDPFASANLTAETTFSGYEFMLGIFLISGITAALIFIKKSYILKIISIFSVSILFINLTVLFIVPQVEKISQRSAIEFYKDRADEDAYFITFHYKSYAQLFYGKVQESKFDQIPSLEQQLKGKVDKPVYAVCKNISENEFVKRHSNFIRLYDKNGFVFWQRIK